MALPVFTSDDFTVIRTHVRNVKNGYFVNVTFVAVIVIFIFYLHADYFLEIVSLAENHKSCLVSIA